MAVDGSLNFDTKVDSKGFTKGIKSINSSVGQFADKLDGLKTKMLAAFSLTALTAFAKQALETAASVNAANSSMSQTFGALESAAHAAINRVADESGILETRLRSTATGIYAFARTSGMDSASALVMMEDALRVAADSAAYYDRSLEDTSETLKSFLKGNYANDAALGLSATEATRNAAAMKLYGKSFQNLSEAQKQLTLLQMVKDANDLSGATGQAAREAEGWENVVGNLKEAWKQLLAVIGQPVLKLAIPVVQSMTAALARLTDYANAAWQALSKVMGWEQVDAISAAAESQKELTAAVKETEKAQEGALAGFDEIQTLTDKSASTASSDGTSAAISSVTSVGIELDESSNEKLNAFTAALEALRLKAEPTMIALQGLAASAGAFTAPFGEGLSAFYQNILVPCGDWALTTLFPSVLENLSSVLEFLGAAASAAQPGISWLWENFLQPAAEWTGDAIVEVINSLTNGIEGLTGVLSGDTTLGEYISNLSDLEVIVMSVVAAIALVAAGIAIYNAAMAIAAIVTNATCLPIILVTAAIAALIAIIVLCVKHWDQICAAATWCWDRITAVWSGAKDWLVEHINGPFGSMFLFISDLMESLEQIFSGVVDFIAGVFTGDWNRAWEGVVKVFKGVFNGIVAIASAPINLVIDLINGMVEAITAGLNYCINAINKLSFDVPDWVPGIGGKTFGFNIPTLKAMKIPYLTVPKLASGAVIPPNREFLAVLGDQTQGTNIEAPLETIKQAFREALAESGGSARQMTVILQVGRRELGRTIVELGREEEQRVGMRIKK